MYSQNKDHQGGFGMFELLCAIVMVIAVLVASIVVVYKHQHSTAHKKSATQAAAARPVKTHVLETQISRGNAIYVDKTYGYTLSYPAVWGKISSSSSPDTPLSVVVSTDDLKDKSGVVPGTSNSFGWSLPPTEHAVTSVPNGRMLVRSEKVDDSYVWRVYGGPNAPTPTAPYAVGDTYPLPVYKNAAGVTFYDLGISPVTAADCTSDAWLFVTKKGLVQVIAPSLCPASGPTIDPINLRIYKIQLDLIVNSFTNL
jgi:Tfp pilus assembly protein PilE